MAKAGRFDEAIGWFERARSAPDGTSSLAAMEQLANLKVRRAWQRTAQGDDSVERARQEIAEAMALLDTLLAVGHTVERESLYGSAYKRLALIEAAAGQSSKEAEAISRMKDHYQEAEQIVRTWATHETTGRVNVFYPAMNRIAAQLALEGGTTQARALDQETLETVRRSMSEVPPDFWSVVGQTELNMYASLSAGTLAQDLNALTQEFQDHADKVHAVHAWASVYDNATFVLSKYMMRAKETEARAARLLLDSLAKLAGRNVPMQSTPDSTRRTKKIPRKRRSTAATRKRASRRAR